MLTVVKINTAPIYSKQLITQCVKFYAFFTIACNIWNVNSYYTQKQNEINTFKQEKNKKIKIETIKMLIKIYTPAFFYYFKLFQNHREF